jgi:dTDP-4-dehydrorhamnose 3,5-epimerase
LVCSKAERQFTGRYEVRESPDEKAGPNQGVTAQIEGRTRFWRKGCAVTPFSFEKTPLDGLLLVKPKAFGDNRGFFMETFARREFESAGVNLEINQISHSRSMRGVLRGLHFQRRPYEQAKLVRCIIGEILDVAVDIRPNSGGFGGHFSINLSDSNRLMLYMPRGFAHGFVALSEIAEIEYAVDNSYAPDHEGGVIWNDPDLAIPWPIEQPVLSEKDKKLPALRDLRDSLLKG